jgi:hypothetical protein
MPKDQKTRKKFGREQEVEPEELVRRYAALKRFLDDNWGRIGLELPRVRRPEHVKSVLDRVQDAQWCPAFRDFPTGCLLREGSKKVSWREVRETREKYKEAKRAQGLLSLGSHDVTRRRKAFELHMKLLLQRLFLRKIRKRISVG